MEGADIRLTDSTIEALCNFYRCSFEFVCRKPVTIQSVSVIRKEVRNAIKVTPFFHS
jgi:hypothetical protein